MKSLALRGSAVTVAGVFLVCLLSCGHDQQLVSISVSPNDVTINGFATVQYRALGQYIHPPQTKDITSTVLWQSSAPSVIAFTSNVAGEAVPSGTGCGTNLIISAVVYGDPTNPPQGTAAVGTATVNVDETQLPPPCGP
jgi:hypothetical protein